MIDLSSWQNILLKTYAVSKTKGILKNPFTQKLYTSAYFLYKRFLEDPFYTLVKHYPELFQQGHILDIGAYIGYNARLFSRVVSPGFQIFPFEPDRENFRQLEKTCISSKSIIPIRYAVGAKSGSVDLWRNPVHPGDHRIATAKFIKNQKPGGSMIDKVPVTTIDAFARKRNVFPISFIKIDVQGYELPVCLGMRRTLELNLHALVAIEYSPADLGKLGFDPLKLLSFWKRRDYIGYELTLKGVQKAKLETLHHHAVKNGYSNILFKHTSRQIVGLL